MGVTDVSGHSHFPQRSGVDPFPELSRISNIHLDQLIDQDYAKVLSNGMDTLLVLSPSGHVVEHLALDGKTEP